jgi:predicted ATPase
VATAKILLLVNYRPEYRHDWASKTYYTRLRLDPLGKEEAGELLTALVGDGGQAGLQSLRQLILEKTEGNPFFMEEVVQTLAEEGVLSGERGRYRLEKTATDLHIPTTVQAVLAARIDRLPADEKEFLQTLSVIGKEFPFGLLRKVVGQPEDEVHRLLSHLQAGEFIYEQPAFPEPEYTFKHALTQEVAYQSVLVERRKVLHERTAQAIEELYQAGLDAHYSELAHHYSRTDNIRKAVEYLGLAGLQAVGRSAYGEAISQLTRGLELIQMLPETPERNRQEIPLQVALGRALMVTKGYATPEAEHAYVRGRELCQRVGETPELFSVLDGIWVFYLARGQINRAHELGEQLLGLAQSQRDLRFLPDAHERLGHTYFFRGEFPQAREHLEQTIALHEPKGHRAHVLVGADPGVRARSYAALTLSTLGYPAQALQRSREAVNEKGFPVYLGSGTFLRGWAQAAEGQLGEGIAKMHAVLDAFRDTGMELGMPWLLGLLAEAYAKEGQPKEGLAQIAEAMGVVNKTGQRVFESALHQIKGNLLLALSENNQAEGETSFHQAIDVARHQSAKSLELRAATSLARLWQKQGKKEEARQLLAEIYGWFTEGFDTRDLKEAKALLDELG